MCNSKKLYIMSETLVLKQKLTNFGRKNVGLQMIRPALYNSPKEFEFASKVKSFSIDLVVVLFIMGLLTWMVN